MEAERARFVLTACSRCCGDLVLERDQWGEHYVCLQCGNEEADPSKWRPRGVHGMAMLRPEVRASPTIQHVSVR